MGDLIEVVNPQFGSYLDMFIAGQEVMVKILKD